MGQPAASSIIESPELGKGLGAELHTALREGFSNLYGYTSDESGIRYGLTEK